MALLVNDIWHFFFQFYLIFFNRIVVYWFRNSRWRFLDGVKVTGAPPPRKVIVQQCARDMGILEVLCDYVSDFFFFY